MDKKLKENSKDAEAKLASSSAPTNIRVNDRNEIELYGNAFYRYIPGTYNEAGKQYNGDQYIRCLLYTSRCV